MQSHFEKLCGMQLASPKVSSPYCPRCGSALPASGGSKNAVSVLCLFGLSSSRADKQTAVFHSNPENAYNNSAQVKLT